MSKSTSGLEQLQADWKEMFQKTLPAAATSKSDAQPTWPVHVDHCFARIILDATVGVDAPWMTRIKSPAYKNMTKEQLEASIAMGEQILNGEADLVELDNNSLEVRGKGKKGSGKASGKMNRAAVEKRKREMEEENEESNAKRKRPSPTAKEEDASSAPPAETKEQSDAKQKRSSSPSPKEENDPKEESESKEKSDPQEESESSSPDAQAVNSTKEDLKPWIKKIALSSKTDFQKKVLTAMCQVPRGKYSTYGAIAKYLQSSPRAVGNALRNNPFAPHVPCHRILASGGGLGGFHGSWGKKGQDGLHDDQKRKLLREEGVRFDGKGMVVGGPWEGFI